MSKKNVHKCKRKVTYSYYLRNEDGEVIEVCEKAFCDTFVISRKEVCTVRCRQKNIKLKEMKMKVV